MIELEQARELTWNYPLPAGIETISVEEAMGRVLAEDLRTDRDAPPFNRATMDGFACSRKDLPGPMEVIETVPAGKMPQKPVGKGQCSRIMTGAMVPDGADCVIMQEYMETGEDGRVLFTGYNTETNIHPQGKDLREGDLLLRKGIRLTPGHIGIITSTGRSQVSVSGALKVGILANGSELVEPHIKPEGPQIRDSNSRQLAAQVRRAGHIPKQLGIVPDDSDLLSQKIIRAMEEVDLLLLTGGASAGELDLVPGLLQKLGFSLEFDRVAIQPGKPISFGHRDGKACFGLSGNPVSSFVQFELLVRPYLEKCSGEKPPGRLVRIRMDKGYLRKQADRKFFLPVSFTPQGKCVALKYHGSGHLHVLEKISGFAVMPAGKRKIKKGDWVNVRLI